MTAKSDQLSPAMLNALRRFFYVDTFGVNAAPMTVLRDEVGVLDSYARRGMANKSTVGALERRGLIVSTSGFATTARPVRTQLPRTGSTLSPKPSAWSTGMRSSAGRRRRRTPKT